jgi:flagella basal body P-ring formation protein FlgA
MYRLFVILMVCLLMPQLSGAAPLSAERETEIRNAVISYVQQKQANFSNEIRLKRFSVAGGPSLPLEGKLEYEVIAPQQWGGWGNANLAVIARQGERVIGNINVRTEVEVLAEMLFTVRQINLGSILTAEDLVRRKSDVGAMQGRYLANMDDAVGKKTRMTLRANVPLKNEQIEKVPLVKSGQMVTIVAENERIRITVTGKAKSAGALGDTIIVQNLSSRKELSARIVNAETVQIAY